MNYAHAKPAGVSRIAIFARVSIALLVLVSVWRISTMLMPLSAGSAPVAFAASAKVTHSDVNWQKDLLDVSGATPVPVHDSTDPDGISNIAGNVVGALAESYALMQQKGTYTEAKGEQVAQDVGTTLQAKVSHQTLAPADFQTVSDTSFARMLTYRTDMRTALSPLLKNPDYELKLYANYVASHDSSYLTKLKAEIANYQASVANAQKVVVPADLLSYHVAAVNSLSAFSATLESMIANADDPFASAALLRTYQDDEQTMLNAFNSLAQYERAKKP